MKEKRARAGVDAVDFAESGKRRSSGRLWFDFLVLQAPFSSSAWAWGQAWAGLPLVETSVGVPRWSQRFHFEWSSGGSKLSF